MGAQLRWPRTLLLVRTNLDARTTAPTPVIRCDTPACRLHGLEQLWRNTSMNRKTLVLPAVVGLLAPVLAACGGSDSGSGGGATITVGTTDRFTATKDAPA